MNITLKGIKSFNGMEGKGFSATLYIDGRKAGEVFDDARGGEFCYQILREDHAALLKHAATIPDETNEERVARGLEPLPPHSPDVPELSPETKARCNLDSLIARLVDEAEEAKTVKRWCASAVVFTLKGAKAGEYQTIKPRGGKKAIKDWPAWVAKAIEDVKKKHGDKIETVWNEKLAETAK
jgi:hypothetical protein